MPRSGKTIPDVSIMRRTNELFLFSTLYSVWAKAYPHLGSFAILRHVILGLLIPNTLPWPANHNYTHIDLTTGYWILWMPSRDYGFPPESITRMSSQDPRASFQKLPQSWAWLYICFYQTVIVPLVFDFLRHHYAVTSTLLAWRAGHTALLRTAAKCASDAIS